MPEPTAGQEPVEKPVEVKTEQLNASEADPEAEMAKLLADNKRLSQERENYRKGMLKAKGKLPEEVEPEVSEEADERMRRIVREEMSQTDFAKAQQQLEAQALKMARENKELKKALQNRPATTSNNVTSQDAIEVRDNSVSPELERSVKARFRGDEATKSRKFEEWKRNRRS